MRLGRPAEALRVYQSALRFAPEDPDLLYNLGVLLLGEGRAEEALRAWDRALEGDPSHRQALLGAAVLVQERGMTGGGRRRQAVERLRRLAEEQEGDGGGAGVDEKVYFHLGMLTADEGGEEAANVISNYRHSIVDVGCFLIFSFAAAVVSSVVSASVVVDNLAK